ncbi:hypothetical protein NL676_004174 [Syzygium grande]|nr:hypothetical protein NL676_004174 [Syzygium grande]
MPMQEAHGKLEPELLPWLRELTATRACNGLASFLRELGIARQPPWPYEGVPNHDQNIKVATIADRRCEVGAVLQQHSSNGWRRRGERALML